MSIFYWFLTAVKRALPIVLYSGNKIKKLPEQEIPEVK